MAADTDVVQRNAVQDGATQKHAFTGRHSSTARRCSRVGGAQWDPSPCLISSCTPHSSDCRSCRGSVSNPGRLHRSLQAQRPRLHPEIL